MASNSTERTVVVTGLGVVSALGNDAETFWKNLVSAQCGIDRITAFDPSGFDTQIAAEVKNFDPTPAFPSPKEIRRTDRYSQFGVFAAWQALRDSGLDVKKVNPDEIGAFIGSGICGLPNTSRQVENFVHLGPGQPFPVINPILTFNTASGPLF